MLNNQLIINMLLDNKLEEQKRPALNKRSTDFNYRKTNPCFNDIIRREEKE